MANKSVTKTLATDDTTVTTADAATLQQAAAAAVYQVIYIDPTAATGGDGSLGRPLTSIYGTTLKAGDIILFKGGTTSLGFTISGQGTASASILIGSYGSGSAKINGTIVLDGAAYVTVSHLDITGGNGVGVLLTGDTHDSTISANSIHGGLIGIYVNGDTALSDTIAGNQIYENDSAGVWLDGASGASGSEIRVSANTIYRNGQQGISVHASHAIIDGNTVVNNGLSGIAGASAIHVYGESGSDPAGHDNVITNNVVAYQRDNSSLDGNGIQLDHWTGNNTVRGNLVYGNAGSGVSIYSSGDNSVTGNVLTGNDVDPGGSRDMFAVNTEIFLGEADFAPGSTVNNAITGNTILASGRDTLAFQVYDPVTASANTFGGNAVGTTETGPLWQLGGQTGTTLAGWNTAAAGGGDDLALSTTSLSGLLPTFSASMMDTTYTLHAATFATVDPSGSNILVATANRLNLVGGTGTNWLSGNAGDNVITGGPGNDQITGGAGNDTLRGGGGSDMLFGGPGNDKLYVDTGGGTLIGGDGDDLLVGGPNFSLLLGGAGNDTMVAGTGDTVFMGGLGADIFTANLGNEVAMDFTPGTDKIDLSRLGIKTFSAVAITPTTGGSLLKTGASSYLALMNVDANKLSAADFIFALK